MFTDLYDRLAYSPTAGIALGFVLTLALFLVWVAVRPILRSRFGRPDDPSPPRPAPPRSPRS